MRISSDFDSGNIIVQDASDPRQVRLAIRPDTRSHHFQWFHFKVEGLTLGARCDFSLTNASDSAYSHAWTGYHAAASYDQVNWFRVPSRFEDGALRFGLEPEQAQIWFAYFEPYSRARHDWLIEQALSRAGAELAACGKSLEGRDIQLLRVSRQPNAARKLWIIAQQHPGEHMAEWYMEGVIERLQNRDDPELEALLSQADLYLVPNMNPDGAFHGHLRTNAAGRDLNRAWQDASEAETPEVFFVQQQMRAIGVDLFLDIHGDEEIPHVFTAGGEGNPGYTPRIAELEEEFRRRLVEMGAEFQTRYGYPRSAPGKANLTLACNSVGQEFDCLAFTIEMPFKDHDDTPNPATGWSGARSMQLGKDVLSVMAQMVDHLR
ncbi:M14 family metallopeptidase [Stutzerimonas azotifigens]|uniref:Carboxypeptidase family protein n=1 Tax=Stutzerimonas azotifigens TaxID=291995 RepID=A0ABR5Z0W2_9GAMM|nr:carboxypeptidase family protein [Stutzerimonas azotifigens]MBA1273824.1 carboxypeptidase family protein [Stutzerimonas azotifigens]